RPDEVRVWMKNGRKFDRIQGVSKVAAFGKRWRSWWSVMQPEWRRAAAQPWPMVRENREDEPWDELRKGGQNGFVLILLTLVWWT
ncbi:hypothetical protein FA95DRAFT_1470623, partial [Auriscalpium vulgare]